MAAAIESSDIPRPRPGRFNLPDIDALRFFAFLAVFSAHLWIPPNESERHAFIQNFGSFGVDLFFALSAYLITELLMRERDQFGDVRVGWFWVRRMLRIWPLYFTFVPIAFALNWLNVVPERHRPNLFFAMFALFVGNFAMFLNPGRGMGMGPLWSVCLEEQFYVTWPWLMRHASRKRLIIFAVAAWSVSAACRFWLMSDVHVREHTNTIWYFTFARLDSLACGILIAAWLHNRDFPRVSRAMLMLTGIGAWAIAAWIQPNSEHLSTGEVAIAYPLVAVGAGAFLLATFGFKTIARKVPIYLGRISYGLYVVHALILLFVYKVFSALPVSILWIAYPTVALGLIVGIAAASYRWHETRFLQLKKRFTRIESGAMVQEAPPAPAPQSA